MVKKRGSGIRSGFYFKNKKIVLGSVSVQVMFFASLVFLSSVLVFSGVSVYDTFFSRGSDDVIFYNPSQTSEKFIIAGLYATSVSTIELAVLNLNAEIVAQADFPEGVHSLALGDADNDMDKEIVVGLYENLRGFHGGIPPLRIMHFNTSDSVLKEEIVNIDLRGDVRTVDIGDADNDGQNEILFGFEDRYYPIQPFLGVYKKVSGSWEGTFISDTDDFYSMSLLDAEIADLEGDGQNEVIALFGDLSYWGSGQVRQYKKSGTDWIRENVTSVVRGVSVARGARSMTVGDVDGDGDKEIVVAYVYTDSFQSSIIMSRLVYYEKQGNTWSEKVIARDIGHVGTIRVADFNLNGKPEVIIGMRRLIPSDPPSDGRIKAFEYNTDSSVWEVRFLSPYLGTVPDIDFGDVDNDGQNEMIVSGSQNLTILESGDENVANVFYDFDMDVREVLFADFSSIFICGNSIIETGEQCDDGNTINGDGCSSTCRGECFDSDYGNYYKKGITGPDLNGVNYTDFCHTTQYNLMEYSCVDGLVTNSSFYCARGCLNGACKSPLGSSPTPVAPSATNPSPGSGAIQ